MLSVRRTFLDKVELLLECGWLSDKAGTLSVTSHLADFDDEHLARVLSALGAIPP